MSITAWGHATIVEETRISQSAGEKTFATVVQLLEDEDGELMVRFAYATEGVARRGPVTMRKGDLAKLRRALAKTPRLKELLAF